MPSEPTSPLFVRLPAASAEKLSRAAFELKTPKRELVADLVDRYLGAEDVVVGRAAPELRGPDVLTLPQLAELLQADEKTVRALATAGGQPAPFVIALSRSSGVTPASSRTRTQSFRSGIRIRLTMNPGVSLQLTGCLPAVSAHS